MFHGSIVALVTPMQPNSEVDYDCFKELIDWHIEAGTDGIVVLGTTGESPTINANERAKLIRLAVKQCAGRVPVIAGTGANSTTVTIQYSQEAMDAGADACLVVTPYYNKPTQQGLYLHFKTVAENVAAPQILYNVPGRTGVDLVPETVIRLADVPNIVGVKEATGEVDRVKTIQDAIGDKLDLYSGDDQTAFEFMRAGGKGVISVTANVAPKEMHQMCVACLNGDFETAHELDQQLQPLHKNLFVESNPIPTKWALHNMGKIPAGIRMPLTQLSEAQQPVVQQALQQSGVL